MAAALSTGYLRATDDFSQGDLALVFYSVSTPAPGAFGTEYYVFNLGPASSFRENTLNNVAVKTVNPTISNSNIAADLVSVFGSDWADAGTVRMMAVATIELNKPANQDPSRTVYFTAPRNSLDSGQKGYDALTSFTFFQGNPDNNTIVPALRGQMNNDLVGFLYTATNGAIGDGKVQSGANVSGNRLTTSYLPNLSSSVPPVAPTYFKFGIDPAAVLATQTNAVANGVHIVSGTPELAVGGYALVVANILATPLKVLAPLLCSHVAPGGRLLLAGILERQCEELTQAYAPYCALEVLDSREGWILMSATL